MSSTTVKNFTEAGDQATKVAERKQNRIYGILYNNSDVTVYFGFSKKTTAGAGADSGIPLKPGQSIAFPQLAQSNANELAIYAVHAEADNTNPEVRWVELPGS